MLLAEDSAAVNAGTEVRHRLPAARPRDGRALAAAAAPRRHQDGGVRENSAVDSPGWPQPARSGDGSGDGTPSP